MIIDEYTKRLEMIIEKLDPKKENERMIARGIMIARRTYRRWKNRSKTND